MPRAFAHRVGWGLALATGPLGAQAATPEMPAAAELPPAVAPLPSPLPEVHHPGAGLSERLALPRIDTAPVAGRPDPSPKPVEEKLQEAARGDNWLLDSLEALKGEKAAQEDLREKDRLTKPKSPGLGTLDARLSLERTSGNRTWVPSVSPGSSTALNVSSSPSVFLFAPGSQVPKPAPTPLPNPYLEAAPVRPVGAPPPLPAPRATPPPLPTPLPAPSPVDAGLKQLPRF